MKKKDEAPAITDEMMCAYTLYHYSGNPPSDEAVRKCQPIARKVHFVDLKHAQDIPEFLAGVPTWYSKKKKEIYEGTQCLQQIDAAVADMSSGSKWASSAKSNQKSKGLSFKVDRKKPVEGSISVEETQSFFTER